MFVDVPDPVWKMSMTKCSSNPPSATSCAARDIADPVSPSNNPNSTFTSAAVPLINANAWMKLRENLKLLMGKFNTARMVEAP